MHSYRSICGSSRLRLDSKRNWMALKALFDRFCQNTCSSASNFQVKVLGKIPWKPLPKGAAQNIVEMTSKRINSPEFSGTVITSPANSHYSHRRNKPGMWGNTWASAQSKTPEWKSAFSPSCNISLASQHCMGATFISGSALISFSPPHTSWLPPSLFCHIHEYFSEQQLYLCAVLGNGAWPPGSHTLWLFHLETPNGEAGGILAEHLRVFIASMIYKLWMRELGREQAHLLRD